MVLTEALEVIKEELELFLGNIPNNLDVHIESLQKFKDNNANSGIYLSLVNIEKETSIGHIPPFKKVGGASIEILEPPVHVNLLVMVTSHFTQYDTSLSNLSDALEFFQSKPTIDKYNTNVNTWPDSIETMVLDWYNVDINSLNQIWGINGSLYKPSYLFKVRMLKIQHVPGEPKTGPAITEIKLENQIQ